MVLYTTIEAAYINYLLDKERIEAEIERDFVEHYAAQQNLVDIRTEVQQEVVLRLIYDWKA